MEAPERTASTPGLLTLGLWTWLWPGEQGLLEGCCPCGAGQGESSVLGQVGALKVLQQKPLQPKTHIRRLVSAQDTETCIPGDSSPPSSPAASAMPGSRVGIFPVYAVLIARFCISFRFPTGGAGSTSMLRRNLS